MPIFLVVFDFCGSFFTKSFFFAKTEVYLLYFFKKSLHTDKGGNSFSRNHHSRFGKRNSQPAPVEKTNNFALKRKGHITITGAEALCMLVARCGTNLRQVHQALRHCRCNGIKNEALRHRKCALFMYQSSGNSCCWQYLIMELLVTIPINAPLSSTTGT